MRAPDGGITTFTTQTTKSVGTRDGLLQGGKYQLTAVCATWNSASLQLSQVGPDGSTAVNIGSAITANGTNSPQVVDLPPGQYNWTVSVGTPSATLSAAIKRIPND